MHYYNSRDINCKNPLGAVSAGTPTEFTVYAKNGVYVDSIYFALRRDGETFSHHKMQFCGHDGENSVFKVFIKFPDKGLYFYKFTVWDERGTRDLLSGVDGLAQAGEGAEYALTVFSQDYKTPDWLKGGLIYHIFMDRFCRGADKETKFEKNGVLKEWDEPVTTSDPDGVFRANDFYGGNFQGVLDKLDYLESLGVTLIYLSPIFKSASNHRYDTGDYMQFDELLGTEKKFKELIEKAKKRGINIMLDGVFNHTGADSRYFNKFGNYPELGAYQSKDSKYADWYEFFEFPDKYRCWWGVTVSPTVNKQNKEYRDLILGKDGVLEKYTKMGVKGWRLDVVDELDVDFVDNIRKTVKSIDGDAVIIGEVWEDASVKTAYGVRREYFQGSQLDGVMNYPFKNAVFEYVLNGDLQTFLSAVYGIIENYPKQSLDVCMNIIGTHDTERALNVCGFNAEKVKLAAAIEFFLPGVPSVYYGDETGLDGGIDPLNRKPMPWGKFKPEIFEFYKKLGNIRKKFRPLFVGKFNAFVQDGLLVIERAVGNDSLRLVINNTGDGRSFNVDGDESELLSGAELKKGLCMLEPGKILVIKRGEKL